MWRFAVIGLGALSLGGAALAEDAPSASANRGAAADFAEVIASMMVSASAPEGTYSDWRAIEASPLVQWKPLPPEMLDKPLEGEHFFRRTGTAILGLQPVKAMAGGARTIVMALYFRNDGPPIGEEALLAGLRGAGLTVAKARCPIERGLPAPQWYRLSGAGKRAAHLWIAPARGGQQPWEGFNLSLDPALKPMSAAEARVYTDRCD